MITNQKLKALRNSRNCTVREVELESRRIAEAKGDNRFYISNTRLSQLENDPSSEPSLWKLFSLSVIYHVRFTDLTRLYNVDAEDADKYGPIATPERTLLLSDVPYAYHVTKFLGNLVEFPAKTTLLPRVPGCDKSDICKLNLDSQFIRYGYIGLDDFTMYPMIRPGSFVWLDTRQNRFRLIAWRSEYDRPIYFIELHDAYSCGWCELQGNQLLIIPHHSSHATVQRFTYQKEAEIIGRVVKFSTPCINEQLKEGSA